MHHKFFSYLGIFKYVYTEEIWKALGLGWKKNHKLIHSEIISALIHESEVAQQKQAQW